MTDAQRVAGVAYDDASTAAEMTADCRAAEARLAPLPALDSVARAAARGPVSLRFEDFDEVRKPEIHPAAAARRIAAALDLDLD